MEENQEQTEWNVNTRPRRTIRPPRPVYVPDPETKFEDDYDDDDDDEVMAELVEADEEIENEESLGDEDTESSFDPATDQYEYDGFVVPDDEIEEDAEALEDEEEEEEWVDSEDDEEEEEDE